MFGTTLDLPHQVAVVRVAGLHEQQLRHLDRRHVDDGAVGHARRQLEPFARRRADVTGRGGGAGDIEDRLDVLGEGDRRGRRRLAVGAAPTAASAALAGAAAGAARQRARERDGRRGGRDTAAGSAGGRPQRSSSASATVAIDDPHRATISSIDSSSAGVDCGASIAPDQVGDNREIGGFGARLTHIAAGGQRVALWQVDDLERYVDRHALLAAADAPEPPYWAHLWSGARVLADAVPRGRLHAVELGCGLGLPGLVAALHGGTGHVRRPRCGGARVRAGQRGRQRCGGGHGGSGRDQRCRASGLRPRAAGGGAVRPRRLSRGRAGDRRSPRAGRARTAR